MKYEFVRSAIQAELTSSEDCQTLIMDIKKETELMMAELDKVKAEFLAQENRSKRNNVKTFRKGKDVYVKVEDVEGLINKILNERGLNIEHAGMPTLSGMPNVKVIPLSEIMQESLPDGLLRALQHRK